MRNDIYFVLSREGISGYNHTYDEVNVMTKNIGNKLNLSFVIHENNNLTQSNFYDFRQSTGKWYFLFGSFVSRDGIMPKQEMEDFLKTNPDTSTLQDYFVNGSYICITGDSDGNFTLFNDFYGLIPVYYQNDSDSFIASSSLEKMLEHRSKATEADPEGLNEYMMYGSIPSENTLIKGISKLLPASQLGYGKGIEQIKNYRKFPEQDDSKIRFTDYAKTTAELAQKSIHRLYNKDLNYDLSFTGGMDSRIIYGYWPDRDSLITETAGSQNSSDYLKVKQLLQKFGNETLHHNEQTYPEKYEDGLFDYLFSVDNPLKVGAKNTNHLNWKASLGADIHLSGIGGELMGGENMYQSRKPAYVLKEGILGYSYNELKNQSFISFFNKVFAYSSENYLKSSYIRSDNDKIFKRIEDAYRDYFGETTYPETLTERLRTYFLAVMGIYYTSAYLYPKRLFIAPYNDYEFISYVSKYHPKYRELRKLELNVLKNMKFAKDVKIDTTHLKVNNPYVVHRFFRMLRFIFNIGYAKKVPFIQEGDALQTRIPKYFWPEKQKLRKKVNDYIRQSNLLDQQKVEPLLSKYEKDSLDYNHFKATHKDWPTILKLLRLAVFEEKYLKNKV